MVCLVRSRAPWGKLGSFGSVRFILGRNESLYFGSGSSDSTKCALGVSCFLWFVRVHPGGRLVCLGSTASFGSSLGVAGFVRVRLVPSRALWGSLGSFVFL